VSSSKINKTINPKRIKINCKKENPEMSAVHKSLQSVLVGQTP